MVLREYPADWNALDWVGLERLRMRAKVLSNDVTRLPAPSGRASQARLAAEL